MLHPGKLLKEEIDERGITQKALAQTMGRPPQVLSAIVQGKKHITPETALQLEKALGIPAHIWINLETEYQLAQARERRTLPH